jgi:predicted P-loop ATPase
MTLDQGDSLTQPCSGDDYKASLCKVSDGFGLFDAGHWAAERLPLLDGIGPLLPGGADKRPLVGDGWPEHPGLSIDKLQAAAPECICWHVGADPGHIGIDIDGPAAAAFCQSHGCDPYTADTWRIIRTSNSERLKLVFTVTTEQRADLVAGAKTVKIDGQELAVFAKTGTQIVVLGNHYTKESNYTENDDQYAWAGRNPADAQPLPPEWFALLTGVFCGERPLKPPTRRQVSTPSSRKSNAYKSSGGWSNSSSQQPCPVCGRDHSGACSINTSGAVWCCHGETKSAPDCSRTGEKITGSDGQTWGYVRTEEHDSFGERSLFVLDKPRQKAQQAHTNKQAAPSPQRPSSLQALIQQLLDGWDPNTLKPQTLSAGRIADMLPAAALRFNEMTLRAEVHTSSGWTQITDADMDSAYVVLSGKGWKVGSEPVIKAIVHTARQAPHHPVRAYLQQVEADPGIAPFDLDQVAPQFFRTNQQLHVAMVRKWLIGAVSRVLNPGCQMDYVLVLQGGQGQLKSTSLKATASPDWYCSSIPENEKDLLLNIHSTWIYELAELESVTSRKEAGRLKNLITTSTDLVRVPYGRTNERMARQSVFCATVNEDTFLRDDTGNRRFWVVPVEGAKPIDKAGLLAARDAIWKAAVAAYRVGELPMLPPELEALSSQQNQEFNQQDPWVEMVLAWMDGEPLHRWDPDRDPGTVIYDANRPFTSAEILYSAGLRRLDQITRADEMRVAAVLRQLKFDRAQKRVNGRTDRFWLPSQPSQPSQPQAEEVVTPETPSAAVGLGVPSQPSQPISTKRGLKEEGHTALGAGAISQESFEKSRRGCDTLGTSLAPQSVCPVTTSFPEVVTPHEVVTPSARQENEARIRELGHSKDLSGWPDNEVAELRQSLEQVAKRQASGFAIPVQEVA